MVAALAMPVHRILSASQTPSQNNSDLGPFRRSGDGLSFDVMSIKPAWSETTQIGTERPSLLGRRAYRLNEVNFSPSVNCQDPNLGSHVDYEQFRMRMEMFAPYVGWVRTFGCTSNVSDVNGANTLAVGEAEFKTRLLPKPEPEIETDSDGTQLSHGQSLTMAWTVASGGMPRVDSRYRLRLFSGSIVGSSGAFSLGAFAESDRAIAEYGSSTVVIADSGITDLAEQSSHSVALAAQSAELVPTITGYTWNTTPTSGQTFSVSINGTGFNSSGTQYFVYVSNCRISYRISATGVTLTEITEDREEGSYLDGPGSFVPNTWVFSARVRDRRAASEILGANDRGSDCEALDFDRNLLSEPYATIESIRSSLTSNASLLESDVFAAASEASLFDSNTADAGGGHHALRAIAFTAARVIRRCGKRAEINAPVEEGSDAVLATRYVDIGARIRPGPTKLLVWCTTGKCLPGDVGRPPS